MDFLVLVLLVEVVFFAFFGMLAIVVDTANNFPALKLLPSEETDPSSSWSNKVPRLFFFETLTLLSDFNFDLREISEFSSPTISLSELVLLPLLLMGEVPLVFFFGMAAIVVDTANNFPALKLLPSVETETSSNWPKVL